MGRDLAGGGVTYFSVICLSGFFAVLGGVFFHLPGQQLHTSPRRRNGFFLPLVKEIIIASK